MHLTCIMQETPTYNRSEGSHDNCQPEGMQVPVYQARRHPEDYVQTQPVVAVGKISLT